MIMTLNTCLKRLTFQIYDDTYYFCLILNNSMEKVWSLSLSVVWVRKLKLRGVEWLSWGHTARAQVSQHSSVFFLADQEGSYKQGHVPGSWWVACSHCFHILPRGHWNIQIGLLTSCSGLKRLELVSPRILFFESLHCFSSHSQL